MAKLKILQTNSVIDRLEKQKRTIYALGLGRPGYITIKEDNLQVRGMLRVVGHLVKVEEVN